MPRLAGRFVQWIKSNVAADLYSRPKLFWITFTSAPQPVLSEETVALTKSLPSIEELWVTRNRSSTGRTMYFNLDPEIEELRELFPELRIVHGPRLSFRNESELLKQTPGLLGMEEEL